jgi:hypothetical protein
VEGGRIEKRINNELSPLARRKLPAPEPRHTLYTPYTSGFALSIGLSICITINFAVHVAS